MTGFQGMDPVVVRGVARRMRQQAQQLDEVIAGVQRAVQEAFSLWDGDDATGFSTMWTARHRPAIVAAHAVLVDMAATVERNVDEQEKASGAGASSSAGSGSGGAAAGGSPYGLRDGLNDASKVGSVLSAAVMFFGSRFLPRARDGRWVSPATLSAWERQAAQLRDSSYVPKQGAGWKALDAVGKRLGWVGVGLAVDDVQSGLRAGDGGKVVMGVGGLIGAIPNPVGVAASGATLYGDAVLPTNNDEYSSTYDMALRRQFGSAYDPANPTMEQAQWGMKRYEGPVGFLNSVSDGMDYKITKNADRASQVAQGIARWVAGR